MNNIYVDIEKRLQFGKTKYGHGVRIDDDMAKYTRSEKDSFIDMQLEEILDGIIYTACSNLRWIDRKYGHVRGNKEDDNDSIKGIILDTECNSMKYTDPLSLKYRRLLKDMLHTYVSTYELKTELEANEMYLL